MRSLSTSILGGVRFEGNYWIHEKISVSSLTYKDVQWSNHGQMAYGLWSHILDVLGFAFKDMHRLDYGQIIWPMKPYD